MALYSPMAVGWLGNVGNFLVLLPLAWSHALPEWRRNRKAVVSAGIIAPGSYLLFLFALRVGGLAKIAAAREIGIVFSVILGMVVLRERWLWRRLFGSVVIMLGVVLLCVS